MGWLVVLYMFVVFVLWIACEFWLAPTGYEDEDGFHKGTPPENKQKKVE